VTSGPEEKLARRMTAIEGEKEKEKIRRKRGDWRRQAWRQKACISSYGLAIQLSLATASAKRRRNLSS